MANIYTMADLEPGGRLSSVPPVVSKTQQRLASVIRQELNNIQRELQRDKHYQTRKKKITHSAAEPKYWKRLKRRGFLFRCSVIKFLNVARKVVNYMVSYLWALHLFRHIMPYFLHQ